MASNEALFEEGDSFGWVDPVPQGYEGVFSRLERDFGHGPHKIVSVRDTLPNDPEPHSHPQQVTFESRGRVKGPREVNGCWIEPVLDDCGGRAGAT